MKQKEINKVEIRNLQKEDYDQLASSFTRVYADGSDVFWTPEQIDKLIRIFPEGQIVTVVDDKIVGCALSIIVNYNDVKNDHKSQETKHSTLTRGRGISCMVSKCSYTPIIGAYASPDVCTNIAKSCVKSSI
jgi:hypothetical protein